MKRFTNVFNKKKDIAISNGQTFSNAPADSPEANVGRAIRLFCESGSSSNGGEEVLHLPVIVEAAESSPTAAAAAAQQIRKFLSRDWALKPHAQYNAIMLVRILSDNPGASFTRNFDKGFVSTIKDVLRSGKDQSTQQILRETLDALEVNKQHDEGVQLLLQMWRKEKGNHASLSYSGSRAIPPGFAAPTNAHQWQPPPGQHQNVNNNGSPQGQPPGLAPRSGRNHTLPPPFELASRIEEARNTAKILLQLIQSTSTEEILQNDLVREFSERCQSAQRSMQGYISCDSPAPDYDTMQTLIETNEQLSLAGSRYQRAILAARRSMGITPSLIPETQNNTGYSLNQPSTGQRESFMPQSMSPPPHQPLGFGSHQQQMSGMQSYQSQPSPPHSMVSSFQQHDDRQSQLLPRNEQPEALSHVDRPANPFADPLEHDNHTAPMAIEPTNYGAAARQPLSSHSPQPSRSFSVEVGPIYSPSADLEDRRNTTELENAYSASVTPVSQPSPTTTRSSPRQDTSSTSFIGPSSAQRPGSGAWHDSGATPSYMNRQSSAINGLTMHGAQSDNNVAEIDSHSDVGRSETKPNGATPSSHTGSPTLRTAQPGRRVDIAGTGGFRNAV